MICNVCDYNNNNILINCIINYYKTVVTITTHIFLMAIKKKFSAAKCLKFIEN